MSVNATENDPPRFFVGGEDGEGLLDSARSTDYEHFYDHGEEEEEEYDSPPERQIAVGICSMAKKSKSKPMKEILERLSMFKYITVVIFEEDVILNEPVENWPLCDCLISFHSKGFPLDKAVAYAKLRNPFIINDLNMQYHIQDRREVYGILKAEGILLPRYAVLNRDPNNPQECNLIEGEDHVEVNGEIFQKPFVEKPVSAEDHNVYIYYPTSAGGGSQRLFRKIGSRSSVYSPESSVRKTGSYIYEEFMPTDGTDVKVYTVGPDYAHAEARKSPALDGKVERDSEGKEVRYPVILNAREKLIAWKVCLAFKEVLDIARQLLVELGQNNDSEIEESKAKLEQLKTVLEMYGHFSGINRKVQLTYLPHGCPKTSSEEEGDYAGFPGCGLLRLHSTYRHDLKIYASDEGRVQMTAAAFAKGLLALEGELTPILVQMVKSANMNGLLDSDSDSLSSCQHRVKARLHEILQRDREFTADDYDKIHVCPDIQLYHSETLELMLRRWAKLEKDFKTKNGRYDISKIPDIYDCIKYDVQHNGSLKLENTMELYRLSKALADIVIPQEYGISKAEKLEIAKGYCTPLVRKIRSDLQRTQDDDTVNKLHPLYSRGVMSPERHVRTRLYFTSESHVHSLLSTLRYGALCDESKDEQWKRAMDYLNVVNELNYMTQIVIMLYEDPNKELSSEERFHVELHFSPGAKGCEEDKNLPSGYGYRPASRENEGSKKTSHRNDSDEEVHAPKRDETDRSVVMFKPMVSDPIHIHRKSPLPRSRKIGSVEEESPLSVSSPECIGTWLHYTSGVGTGRRRRRSGEQITSSPVSPKSLAFTSSIFGSWQQVLSESNSNLRTPRTILEQKQSGLGSHCAGLFSTSVLGGSSSAPNLQDYARTHRKKLTSSGFIDDTTRGSAVKRFSISFARHPTNGFELYSMVPSICPLETLHNSLSLKQVDEFLASVAAPSRENLQETCTATPTYMMPLSGRKISLNTFTPAKIQPTPLETLPERLVVEKLTLSTLGCPVNVSNIKPSLEEASVDAELCGETPSEKK
ncbi:hypothetical protein EK904_002090 [Melospiza melodia maxima]|nr:hypothetical protein EK904_002090 [Melospiza melodia maxima]